MVEERSTSLSSRQSPAVVMVFLNAKYRAFLFMPEINVAAKNRELQELEERIRLAEMRLRKESENGKTPP